MNDYHKKLHHDFEKMESSRVGKGAKKIMGSDRFSVERSKGKNHAKHKALAARTNKKTSYNKPAHEAAAKHRDDAGYYG